MAVYPTIPPLKPWQFFDPTEGADGAGMPDEEGVYSIALTTPEADAELVGAAISLIATIDDPAGTDIAKVEFFHDQGAAQTEIGSDDTEGPVYSMIFDSTGVADGAYNLQAKATDAEGNVSSSAKVAVTVNNV